MKKYLSILGMVGSLFLVQACKQSTSDNKNGGGEGRAALRPAGSAYFLSPGHYVLQNDGPATPALSKDISAYTMDVTIQPESNVADLNLSDGTQCKLTANALGVADSLYLECSGSRFFDWTFAPLLPDSQQPGGDIPPRSSPCQKNGQQQPAQGFYLNNVAGLYQNNYFGIGFAKCASDGKTVIPINDSKTNLPVGIRFQKVGS